MAARRRPSELPSGFTLLEVVLAMSVLALVAMVCYGAFHLGIRAVERGEVAVVSTQRLRVASDIIIRQVKSVVPYPARDKELEIYPYFLGTATSLSFVTANGLQGGGGLFRIVYQVMDDPPRLVFTETPYFSPDVLGADEFDASGGRTAVLLDGFNSLKFEYLLNDGADIEWRPRWSGKEEEMLPVAIRVLVDGLPNVETGVWGQEIPIMATNYGDHTGEVDDTDLQDAPEEAMDDAEAQTDDDEGDEE
jgi:prepilin-type N-terminal cleavage/methylation domain-containing protein